MRPNSRPSEGGRVVRLLGQPLGDRMGEFKIVALLGILVGVDSSHFAKNINSRPYEGGRVVRLLGQPLDDRMGEFKLSRCFCYSVRNNFEAFEAFRNKD